MGDTSGALDYVCSNQSRLTTLHLVAWLMLILNGVSQLMVSHGPGTTVIIGLNYVGTAGTVVITGGLLVVCRRRG